MNSVYFATSNEQKFSEAAQVIRTVVPEMELTQLDIDIPEIQDNEPSRVLQHKVDYVRKQTELPFIVDDAYFDTSRYPGLPGAYAKFINSTLGYEGLKKLYEDGDEIRAIANVALNYLGATHTFSGEVGGHLDFRNAVELGEKNLLSNIMHLEDGVSLGEVMRDPEHRSHRGMAFLSLAEWIGAQNSKASSQKLAIGDRWSQRSREWQDLIANPDSYVNFEDNYARVNALIEKYAPGISGKALEIGCGTGEAGRILKSANPSLDVLSTDISDGMLVEARNQASEAGLDIRYMNADVVTDDLGDEMFNMVLSRGVVISHLPRIDVIDWLKSVTRRTNEGGYFIFDFIQDVHVGDVEKPVDAKNEFTLKSMNSILSELGWSLVENSGAENMRVQVVCYRKDRNELN